MEHRFFFLVAEFDSRDVINLLNRLTLYIFSETSFVVEETLLLVKDVIEHLFYSAPRRETKLLCSQPCNFDFLFGCS